MLANETIPALALAVLLLGLAVYFIARQIPTFKTVRADPTLSPEDRRYLHAQARRRVLCSTLIIILAGFLIGWVFIAPNLPAAPQRQDAAADKEPTPEEKGVVRLVTFYVIAFLVTLMAILALAAMDFISTARFALRHQRQLQDERNDIIEQEIARLKQIRRERNGH